MRWNLNINQPWIVIKPEFKLTLKEGFRLLLGIMAFLTCKVLKSKVFFRRCGGTIKNVWMPKDIIKINLLNDDYLKKVINYSYLKIRYVRYVSAHFQVLLHIHLVSARGLLEWHEHAWKMCKKKYWWVTLTKPFRNLMTFFLKSFYNAEFSYKVSF